MKIRHFIGTALLAAACAARAQAGLFVTEAHPSGSGNAPYAADWFELTNTGPAAVNITGYRVDDNSESYAGSLALTGVTTLAVGESAIFLETSSTNAATVISGFKSAWFGGNVPAGLQVGSYSGVGIGLSTGGDAVNIYDATPSPGNRVASIFFGASTANVTFDNAALANFPAVGVATLSTLGVNGAFNSVGTPTESGSPGLVPEPASLALIGLAAVGLLRRR